MPATVRVGRGSLATAARTGRLRTALGAAAFPLIVRPVDAHAGKGLARLDGTDAMAPYLRDNAGAMFYLSRFIDYRSGDGQYRKYRIVLIAGLAYAVHMAIADHCIVHYLNADMNTDAAKRAEEERFMARFDAEFGQRHAAALQAISQRFGLDYLVIDCAQTPAGELLVFEVDTGAVVHAMDAAEVFPYKPAQMQRVFAAFREMLAVVARDVSGPDSGSDSNSAA